MAGLVPAIHALLCRQGVDARHEAGHDDVFYPARCYACEMNFVFM
jgi:hypothetical protein